MKPRLSCPHAHYGAGMTIECTKRGEPCAHQRWCMSKGWAVLTDQAGRCPARRDDYHGETRETAAERRD